MNYFEKKSMNILYERCNKYHLFYERINYEKLKESNQAKKILWWQKILEKKGLANDYYFFIYSIILGEKLKTLNIGYDFLYGMSNNLRQDKDFEEVLIKLSGDIEIASYISKRKLTYLEAADEYYQSACIGTHECKRFNHNCYKCILSHFNPDELYNSLEDHFANAVNSSRNLIFGDSEIKKQEPVKSKK